LLGNGAERRLTFTFLTFFFFVSIPRSSSSILLLGCQRRWTSEPAAHTDQRQRSPPRGRPGAIEKKGASRCKLRAADLDFLGALIYAALSLARLLRREIGNSA
jgi:hypothetical protein